MNFAKHFERHGAPVKRTQELSRVVALPRRPRLEPHHAESQGLVRILTDHLSNGEEHCECHVLGRPCIRELNPTQAWALSEIAELGGLVGPIGVGHGKTVLDILAAMVAPGVKRAVLLIPPNLAKQFERDHYHLSQHFQVPNLVTYNRRAERRFVPGRPTLNVVPYSRFSRPESSDLLEKLEPDLIIADEAHKLRHKGTATTGRVLRYLAANPHVKLCAWSGTLTARSLNDYAHLSAFALRDGSPLPLDPQVVEEWASAVDPSDNPAPAGALEDLCEPGEPLYDGFRRRLLETPGVVSTSESSIGASILFSERKAPPLPDAVKEALALVRKDAVRPDGEELVDDLAVYRTAREIACGFFYRWRFPKGSVDSEGCHCGDEVCPPCESVINKWFDARKEWGRGLREKLVRQEMFLDSPFLCTEAARRAWGDSGSDGPTWKAPAWPAWRDVKDRVRPVPDVVWIDDFLARDAAEWATKHKGIVWYESAAFGAKVAELAGLPLHGGGPDADRLIKAEDGSRSVVASIKSHGTGRDGLQKHFDTCLVAQPPSSGSEWEQLIGRLHRVGQESDTVELSVYRHTPEMREALDKALASARYIEGTMGTAQKLLSADVGW